MLVLSRKESQSICIGSGIEILVVSVRGGRVCLGITAPPEVPVFRKEIIGHVPEEQGTPDAGICVREGIQ
jgi:carbon storage regulator